MKYYCLLGCCLIACSLKAQWQPLNAGTSDVFTAVDFVDAQVGLLCGVNKIWKTTNGGQSWTGVFTGSNQVTLEEVRWVSSQVAIAVGFDFSFNKGLILRSIDGGQNWTSITNNVTSLFTDVFFVNESVGFICGGNTTILKTTNGGVNWSTLLNNNDSDLFSIFFINENMGFAVGGLPGIGRVLRTTNGQNFQDVNLNAPNTLQAVFFPSAQIGYVAGQGGLISKTVNGGAQWTALTGLTNLSNLDLYFLDDQVGYVVGGSVSEATIQKTVDGGAHWTNDSPAGGAGLFSIDFAGNVGYTAGVNGALFKNQLMTALQPGLPTVPANVRIFPNPVADKATVESLDGRPIQTLKLYDAGGRLIRQWEENKKRLELDLSLLPEGHFYLIMTLDNDTVIRKIFKQ